MTLRELNQLRYLRREIASDQRRLRELEMLATSPSSPNLSGISSGGSGGNRIENYVAQIADLQAVIREKIAKLLQEQARLEQYIANVPESYLRQIMTLRFIEGRSWNGVAMALQGTTEAACKMAVQRYILGQDKDKK